MRLRWVRIALGALLLAMPTLAEAQNVPVGLLSKARVGIRCWDSKSAVDALDCWLTRHPDVAGAMWFFDPAFNSNLWSTWPQPVKDQMHEHFKQMVLWYKAGMPAKYPQPFPFPVPTLGPPDPAYGFWMPESLGRRIYLSQVANSLAAELTGAFPWTITTYTPAQLTLLLSMNDSLTVGPVANPGYFFQYGGPSPAAPGYDVSFFKKKSLLGVDAADTIARLFGWERNLTHYFVVDGDPNQNVYPYFWGPESPPIPESKIIEGTVYAGPFPVLQVFGHYTDGCSGTMAFMKSVLRSVNIPVERHWVSCQHATPIFPTVGLAMTHGDDPYSLTGLVTPYPNFSAPAPIEYLVTKAQFDLLFPPAQDDEACTHVVGIQVVDIAIAYGSDYLMYLYCKDLASSADHASGKVYEFLQWYYPLQTLENMGLWTLLDVKVPATNFCAAF
jgi:hypothetical protein